VPYNSKNYHFEIKEVKPQDAACIIETDCNVDFDAPVGYKEPNVAPVGGSAPSSGNASVASSGLANLKKQSAYAPPEHRSSNCPSPAPSSLSSRIDADEAGGGTKIVDGRIVRAADDEGPSGASSSSTARPPTELLASQTGATGIQLNAAIGVQSPGIEYWALNAGGGARLDGKAPTPLKDRTGAEVDLRKIRAEAAARRAAEQARATAALPTVGKTIRGEEVKVDNDAAAVAIAGRPPVKKNKSRVGGKFSKLKTSGGAAFHGGSNQL
jgi:ubiquitin fusion degradation protein 1